MHDVRSIDVTEFKSIRIPDSGIDEFSYLRKAINSLLKRIEMSQGELIESREKLQATLISVGDGVITVGIDGRIQFLNPVAQMLTGWSLEEAAGKPLEIIFNIINEYTRDPVENPVTEVYKTGEIVELANHTLLITKNGDEVPVEDTAAPIRDSGGVLIGCVLVFRDFSERKEKQRYIEYLSYHDHLTGLYNRRYFEEELQRIDIEGNLPLSFVYADVNGLKMINDAYGHDRGDELIQNVAETLKAECRPQDVITRVGGDEFVVMMPHTTTETTEAILKRIDSRLEEVHIVDVPVSISFGWETKVDANQSARDVLRRAESAMYRKKEVNSDGLRDEILRSIISTLRAQDAGSSEGPERT
jgi:diguanylate cyclase (GGDEF)-like protein/PAS domain S-box-containing protein